MREPVAVTERHKPRFVLMTVDDCERMRGAADPHRAFGAVETPAFSHDLFKDDLAPRADDTGRS